MPESSSRTDPPKAGKKASYRQTFREHRKLLSLPVVLAVVIAAWFALGSPKSYESTASLWVDNPASLSSSLGNANPAVLPPSQQEQSVLQELLSTQSFVLGVAHQSGLYQYLATHGSGGFSPTSLLSGGGSVAAKVVGSFGPKQVMSAVPGPQVLQISFRGPTPALAQSTLRALVNELQGDSNKFSQERNQTVIAYDEAQVKSTANALAGARAQVSAYRSQHPGAPASDPNLSALLTVVGTVGSQLTAATQKLNEDRSTARAAGANGSTLDVVDQPSPAVPATGKSKELLIIVAGLFAGLLISFLGAVALTPGKKDDWDADVASAVPAIPNVQDPGNANGNGHFGAPRPADVSPGDRTAAAGPLVAGSARFVDESSPEAS